VRHLTSARAACLLDQLMSHVFQSLVILTRGRPPLRGTRAPVAAAAARAAAKPRPAGTGLSKKAVANSAYVYGNKTVKERSDLLRL
jgi:hypothetical protein